MAKPFFLVVGSKAEFTCFATDLRGFKTDHHGSNAEGTGTAKLLAREACQEFEHPTVIRHHIVALGRLQQLRHSGQF